MKWIARRRRFGNKTIGYLLPMPNKMDEDKRQVETKALVKATRELFLQEGVEGLSVRKVASLAGCSTMSIYSRFGGKDALLSLMFNEGFDTLARHQQAVPDDLNAREKVVETCKAFRRFGHDFPHYYALIFGANASAYKPTEENFNHAYATFRHLARIAALIRRPTGGGAKEDKELANQLFALCHGWVMLEQMDMLVEKKPDKAFENAIRSLCDGAAR